MTIENDVFHYPPNLFDLLVEAVPLLNKSKKGVIIFFKGAGVPDRLLADLNQLVEQDKDSISKYEITRKILTKINEKSDLYLRERREILKRITEVESFEHCWESDRLKAKGLVAEIQKIVYVKDAFVRMQQEKDKEVKKRTVSYNLKLEAIKKKKDDIEVLKKEFYALFSEKNARVRGLKLESVLNKFFKLANIGLKEAFTRKGEAGEGIIEQIDGVIELDKRVFLVEMKWKKEAIGPDDIHAHMGRLYHRYDAHGIYISESGYTSASIILAKEVILKDKLLILFELKEFVHILESDTDLAEYLRQKIQAAIIDKNPFKQL